MKRFSQKYKNIFLAIFLTVTLAFFIIEIFFLSNPAGTTIDSVAKNNWKTYENKNYGFSIDFPSNWKVYEYYKNDFPIINLYKQEFRLTPPFDVFSEVNQISIFPKGLPTELVSGETQESDMIFNFEASRATDYLLSNGQVWATYIVPEKINKKWEDWGFIWISNKIDNKNNFCTRNNTVISFEECNPYNGDIFKTSGKIDQDIKKIQDEILQTFKILK
jgi:hypothetical protein